MCMADVILMGTSSETQLQSELFLLTSEASPCTYKDLLFFRVFGVL